MEKSAPLFYKDIIFASSNRKEMNRNKRLLDDGLIRKIAPKIYSANMTDDPAEIIRKNIFEILGHLYPSSVLSHRSALELKPTSASILFVTYSYTKKIELPGITIRFLEGSGPVAGDARLNGELHFSQFERALLENLQISKRPGPESKTLSIPEIEIKLETILRAKDESALNAIRDRAKDLAVQLKMEVEFNKLNKIISALLNTNPITNLKSDIAIARAIGLPYDPYRMELFLSLFQSLASKTFNSRPEKNTTLQSFRNLAFFESYFSNYIEGTQFEIEDARNIIETGIPMPNRSDDSHDILGTYQLVSIKSNLSILPQNPEQFIELLKFRHGILLQGRPGVMPGQFKDGNNKAGNTHFVDFTLVRGTLTKSFELYQALKEPFAKAAYIMFVISEVHPFNDGNGRTARVFLNAELTARDQSKIIIPTIYREDYLLALKKFSQKKDPEVYVKMLDKAHCFSETVLGDNMEEMQSYLENCNAFKEPEEHFRLKF